jgi:hypothetical protein
MKSRIIFSLFLVLFFSAFLRLFHANSVPAGIFDDEASHGYEAYSLLLTGRDQYGQAFPFYLRSFGTYAAPLYAYLSVVPISLFGLSQFSVHLTSIIASLITIVVTFVAAYKFFPRPKLLSASVSSLLVGISPWSVFFGRSAFESQLALCLFASGLILLFHSKLKSNLFFIGVIFLSLSTLAYQSLRYSNILLLVILLFSFYKTIFSQYRRVLLGLIIYFLIQVPQIALATHSGPSARLSDLNYLNLFMHQNYSSLYLPNLLLRFFYLAKEFSSQYLAYFSPRNLFFDPGPDLHRSLPQLSIFYSWMLVPFFFGISQISQRISQIKVKIFLGILIISPIAAAAVHDPFAGFRVLTLFWVISFIIALGIVRLLSFTQSLRLKFFISFILIGLSLIQLYSSYFVLLPRIRAVEFGYGYSELANITKLNSQAHFVVDSSRGQPPHIFLLFYTHADPSLIQHSFRGQLLNNYYDQTSFSREYKFANIETRPINWLADDYVDQILVGDALAISDSQAQEHFLTRVFVITDPLGQVIFRGFKTNPQIKCATDPKPPDEVCKQYLSKLQLTHALSSN